MGVELAVSPESFEVVVKHLLRKARTNVSMMSKETKGSEDVRLQAVPHVGVGYGSGGFV